MEVITHEEEVITNEETALNDNDSGAAKSKNGPVTEGGSLQTEGHGAVVAAHYNALEEKGLTERNKSRIVYLRNFNNWIKSMLINEYIDAIRDGASVGTPIRVLDMCCGKGGDLLKWRNANIRHLICADIAKTSVDQCRARYDDMKNRQRRERHNHHSTFTAEFIVADCTKERLREQYKDASLQLDLVSCQFSFHYCFESLPQAECMLRNAAECLRPGGYFVGTIPDANSIVARKRAAASTSLGNPVFKIEFENDEPFPLFGAKYGFTLVDVVNCPEFLVHFPTFERLARKYGLEFVSKSSFREFYDKNRIKGRGLLGRMQALESYPAFRDETLNGEENEYVHAKEYLEKEKVDRVGTLSQPEWEAASLYMVFAFRKMKAISMDAQGRPVYENKQKEKTDEKLKVTTIKQDHTIEENKTTSSDLSKEEVQSNQSDVLSEVITKKVHEEDGTVGEGADKSEEILDSSGAPAAKRLKIDSTDTT